MKKILICFIGYISLTSAQILQNDMQAYMYCQEEPHSFIAIIWPIAQGKDPAITKLLNKYGHVMYQKKMFLTKKQATSLLQQAHTHIPNAQPYCGSIKEHLKWYFPADAYKKPARIFVVYFASSDQALACKYAVRNLFPELQYRSIHINDYHTETIQLAKFFFKSLSEK